MIGQMVLINNSLPFVLCEEERQPVPICLGKAILYYTYDNFVSTGEIENVFFF